MVDRRDVLKMSAYGSAGLMAADVAVSPNHANAAPRAGIPTPNPMGKLLVNKDRAREVMARYGIDGMIAGTFLNVYYLTNTITLGVHFRMDSVGYATLPRDPSQPSFLMCTTAETFDIANHDRELPEVIFYTSAARGQEAQPGVEPRANRPRDYAHRSGVDFTEREAGWIAAQDKANDSVAPGAGWAIVRALKQSGLTKGRIAVDDMRIKDLLDDVGFSGVEIVPGGDLFKLIRMVKTDIEIDLMRISGRNNADAAMEAMHAMQPGMTFRDFENAFRKACADRGSDMLSIICGMPGGMMPKQVAEPGKPYIVDAVSAFGQYNGDFARTLVLGEPTKEIKARAEANRIARDTVLDAVKPGVKFSALQKIGFDAMVGAGIPKELVFVTPHSVGLSHTDQPFRLDGFDPGPLDHVLAENMVMTIDLPYLEIGWGGGHCEDLFRVTKTGYELLNAESHPLVVV